MRATVPAQPYHWRNVSGTVLTKLPGHAVAACRSEVSLVTNRDGPRGGVVTQRIANPRTPVRFRARPPMYRLKNPVDNRETRHD